MKESSGGKKERPIKTPKECPSCSYLKPAGIHKCPSCGFAPEKMEEVETVDGELAQVKGKSKTYDSATKQRWWSGLLWYVETRGYKQGWAAHKYKNHFGVWPRGLFDVAVEPDQAVRNYVKSEFIRNAKRAAKKSETAEVLA